jgi:hypothetical protein
MSVSFSCLLLFVSLFLALVRCLAVAIEMLRLNVCWNHIIVAQQTGQYLVSPHRDIELSLPTFTNPQRWVESES